MRPASLWSLLLLASMLTACAAQDAGEPAIEGEPKATEQVAASACNSLASPTRFVSRRAASGRAPDPTGLASGATLEGTWELVDRMVHGSAAGATNDLALTWVVRGDRLESISMTDNDDRPIRGAARITLESDTLTLDEGCGYEGAVDFGYEVTSTELRLHRVLAPGIVEIMVYAKRP